MCLTIDFSSSPRSLPDINAYTMSFLFCIKYAVYARNYFHKNLLFAKTNGNLYFHFYWKIFYEHTVFSV